MAYYLRESFHAGSDRHRKAPPGATLIGQGYHSGGTFRFIRSASLVLHDRCADALGIGGSPDDAGREEFGKLAGGDLCWSPVYSLDAETAPDCFNCGAPVLGRG